MSDDDSMLDERLSIFDDEPDLNDWFEVICGSIMAVIGIFQLITPGELVDKDVMRWFAAAVAVSGMQGRLVWVSIFTGVISIFAGSTVLAWGATSASLLFPTAGLMLVGIGMGLANGHLVALAILAAPEGQESLAGSSVQTMRTLGIGFGAAAAGLFANSAGLADAGIASNAKGEVRAEFPELVATAVDWVHRGEMLLAAAAVVVTVVFFLKGRHLTK